MTDRPPHNHRRLDERLDDRRTVPGCPACEAIDVYVAEVSRLLYGFLDGCSESCAQLSVGHYRHAVDCRAIAEHDWPVPPVHDGPCGCGRLEGTEHFTEHRRHTCGVLPAAVAEAVADSIARDDDDPRVVGVLLEDLAAIGAHRRAAHPELYS